MIALNLPRILLHIVCYLCSNARGVIKQDLLARPVCRNLLPAEKEGLLLRTLCLTLVREPEYRNVFYLRIGMMRYLLNIFLPKVDSMRLPPDIGPGFCPVHSYSTIINARTVIGRNCTVLQNVTIGSDNRNQVPVIGDNVSIGAGAIVLGGIHIGNNVKIGAGAIVVDDVPDNCTVVCEKAKIIQKKG